MVLAIQNLHVAQMFPTFKISVQSNVWFRRRCALNISGIVAILNFETEQESRVTLDHSPEFCLSFIYFIVQQNLG